ncbi:MAG: hypothetical protein WC474_06095 [Hydrogenophilaceae bacterium]
MNKAIRLAVWLAPLLLAGAALAADGDPAADAGASRPVAPGGPPPADASPEERRAYWQKRAAERAAATDPAAAAGADHVHHHGMVMPGPGRGGVPTDTAGHVGRAATSAPAAGQAARRGGGSRDAVLWLTDAPLKREGRPGGWSGAGSGRPGGDGHNHGGGASAAGPEQGPSKRVWLRAGGNPLSARPVMAEEAALLQVPSGAVSELPVEAHGGPYNVSFPTPEEGYYNVYLLRRALDQDALDVTVAKTEVTRSGMGHGLKRAEAMRLAAPRLDKRVPVEIVRERKEDEGLYTRLNYGDEIAFQVLRRGVPVQNARVTFSSGQGWSNTVQSDEDGRARFMVIRDYYPKEWRLFDKRHRETFLVSASFATPEAGAYLGGQYAETRYSATLSGAYYPGVADYESYSDGLMIGMAGLLFTGSGVWWYRRRRVRPFQEVRFDD